MKWNTHGSIYIYIAYIAYIAKYSISCFLKNSARHESWRRAATGILLGIAFQDLVFTKNVSFLVTDFPRRASHADSRA